MSDRRKIERRDPVPHQSAGLGSKRSSGPIPPDTIYSHWGKRALDLTISIPALVLFSPIMAMIAVLVKRFLGPPVLFRQLRPGLHGKLFTIFKFRSLALPRDGGGQILPDDSPEAYAAARMGHRETPLGRFLRRTSLDELPELFNVVRGDMSLVGPRPLLTEYLDRYTPHQARRHDVKPGVTGWAQVNGRQAISYEERFELDVWYVDNVSLKLDLRILGRTAGEVLRGRGVNEPGYATGTEFMGSSPDAPRG
jgi:sugar transferase EpsL